MAISVFILTGGVYGAMYSF